MPIHSKEYKALDGACTDAEETVVLPVIDLHCDLLSYLTHIENADPLSADVGCALPFLMEGRVAVQTLAIFTSTGGSSAEDGMAQAREFEALLEKYSEFVRPLDDPDDLDSLENFDDDGDLPDSRVMVIGAIENASGFCGEDDDLDNAFDCLTFILDHAAPVLYISMTHNNENRFGGGNFSDNIGLKDDGRVLLEYLSGRHIAIDLAHTSDALARDIIEWVDAKNLDVPIMASHSNFRAIHDHVRNLPSDVAKEIIRRGGLIGMNFCHEFIHPYDSDVLMEHIAFGFEELGGLDAMAFGSDFFFTPDDAEFFYDHRNSAQFPHILRQAASILSAEQLHNLAYDNVLRFLQQMWP
jgi:microsomal dipeptidase-like Zn-dependent dipeptidase